MSEKAERVGDVYTRYHFNLTNTSSSYDSNRFIVVITKPNSTDPIGITGITSTVGDKKGELLDAANKKTEIGKIRALNTYKKARGNYHSVSQNSIDEILNYKLNWFIKVMLVH